MLYSLLKYVMFDDEQETYIQINVSHQKFIPNSVPRNTLMNCLYFNAQSLRNKKSDLEAFISTLNYEIHLICVVETWFNKNETAFFNLNNYSAFHSTRPNGGGGGATIYLLNTFDVGNILFEESINNNNFLLLSIQKHSLNVGLCYRQPNNTFDTNADLFRNKLDLILNSHHKTYFFGDFNLNIFDSTSMNVEYKEVVRSNGYYFLNNLSRDFPTHTSSRFSTCIDHIFTDFHFYKANLMHRMYYFENLGDHINLLLNITAENDISTEKISDSRKIINNDKILKEKLLEKINGNTFFTFLDDISGIISNNLLEIKLKKPPKKPFINQFILNLIAIRNKYSRLTSKYPHFNFARERFKHYQKLIKKEVSRLKKEFYNKKFQDNIDSPKNTWENLNSLLYNKSANPTSSCSML